MNQSQEIEIKEINNEEVEIDLLELFAFYLDRIRWIAGAFLVCALLAGLITHFAITPKYTATSKMYMVSSSSQSVVDLTDLNIGQTISSDYVELLQTRPIIEGVIREQNLPYSYKELLEMLSISVINNTRIIKIDATSEDRSASVCAVCHFLFHFPPLDDHGKWKTAVIERAEAAADIVVEFLQAGHDDPI